MFEYLGPIKMVIDILEKCYQKIKRMKPSKKKRLLGRELIKLMMLLQDIASNADELFEYISNSKYEIVKIGPEKFIGNLQKKLFRQMSDISALDSLMWAEQLDELYRILIPELREKMSYLLYSKGSVLSQVLYYLRDIHIRWEDDTLVINKMDLKDLDDIKDWCKTTDEDTKLLERIDEQKQIIDELRDKTEELRKFIINTFNLDELIALTY